MLGYREHRHASVSEDRSLQREKGQVITSVSSFSNFSEECLSHWRRLLLSVSTGFPVLAGALCAMALMFNICALEHGWQQIIQPDGQVSTLPTPGWKTGLTATSLALSAVADILYLLIMTLHFNSLKGYIVTDCCWLASAIMLCSLIGIEAHQHRQAQAQSDQHIIYSESFFACIIAAGLFALISVLLTIYILCVKTAPLGSADKRFIECTNIVFRVNTFIILLLGGAAIYSHIEGWSLIDALYFTDYTLLTIGIGNFVPRTHLGRSLLFPYATGGIISLGLVITSVTSFASLMRRQKLKYKINQARREIYGAGISEKEIQSEPGSAKNRSPTGNEVLRLRAVKSDFYRRRKWAELVLFMVAWFLLWLLSAAVFRRSETQQGWTYFVALYFTFTSLTTIGYGDFFPTSNFGKVFFIFWSLLALPILTNLISAMGDVLHGFLVYLSSHIRRLLFHQRRKREHHEHQDLFNSSATSNMRMANSSTSRLGQCVSSGTGQGQFKSRNVSTQYWLLLAEEIKSLVSIMRDESLEYQKKQHQKKLCCMWSRIIHLLHAGENDAGHSSELTLPFNPAKSGFDMTKLVHFPEEFADRDAEVSWMLSFLVEKLCLDLREELVQSHANIPSMEQMLNGGPFRIDDKHKKPETNGV